KAIRSGRPVSRARVPCVRESADRCRRAVQANNGKRAIWLRRACCPDEVLRRYDVFGAVDVDGGAEAMSPNRVPSNDQIAQKVSETAGSETFGLIGERPDCGLKSV